MMDDEKKIELALYGPFGKTLTLMFFTLFMGIFAIDILDDAGSKERPWCDDGKRMSTPLRKD